VASSVEKQGVRGVLRAALCVMGLAAMASCSVGHGEGEISGTISVPGCRAKGKYDLSPSAFFAMATQQILTIRVQRGGDLELKSDGIAITVEDASLVKRKYLGKSLSLVSTSMPSIDVSLFLNESCPAGRDQTPVVLSAVSGTVVFEEIYAPQVNEEEVEITATLDKVRFEDSRDKNRWAELSGDFDFLYVRGGPAQRFP